MDIVFESGLEAFIGDPGFREVQPIFPAEVAISMEGMGRPFDDMRSEHGPLRATATRGRMRSDSETGILRTN